MADIEEDEDLTLKNDNKDKKDSKAKSKIKKKAGTIFKKIMKDPKAKAVFIKVLLIVLLVIFILGIVLFIINMPGMIKDSIEEWGRRILGNIQKDITGDDSFKITDKEVLELAQHLEDMGYNTLGYGLGNPIYEKDSNGNDTGTKDGVRGKTVKKIGESVDGKDYLRMYIAANEHTYTFAENSLLGFFKTLPANVGKIFKGEDFESGEATSTGLIHIVGSNADSVKKFLVIDRDNKQLKVYSSAYKPSEKIGVLGWFTGMGAFSDFVADKIDGSEYVPEGDSYSYDLENWISRYGRPTELFLALHLSTMMPDLTYKIATEEEFNTKVEMAMMPVNATYEVSATKGDETIDGKKITELYESKVNTLSYFNGTSFNNAQDTVKKLTEMGDGDKLIPDTNWTYNEIAALKYIVDGSPVNTIVNSFVTSITGALTNAPKAFDSVTEDDGHFTKYTYLSDEQVRDIAKVCCREQGNESLRAIAGEASLMANLFEKSRDSNYYMKHGAKHSTDTIYDFIRCDTWFGGDEYRSEETMGYPDGDPNNQVTDDAVNIVKQVLVKGKRTLPIYILEHDSPLDLSYVETNGERHEDVNNHNNYVKDQSIVQQNPDRIPGGGQWTFYCFLSDTSDPFGYYEKTDEEFHYMLDEDSDPLSQSNSTGSFDMLWPFITGVKKHWFYEDIDFTKNVYRFAKDAKKVIGYKSEDENYILNKNNIEVQLNANLTSSMGIIYQVIEPSAMGPNENILKIFDDEYYRYDGTIDRAKKIANAKAGEANKPTFSFNGEDNIQYNKSLSKDLKKEKVSFENNKMEALTAFGILENVHTEAADYIYRDLKELMLRRKYFTNAELTTEVEEIMLWPIKTDNQFSKWETEISKWNFGNIIKCNNSEKIILAPSDAIIKGIDGDRIQLEFTTLNEEDANLLTYIWGLKDPYTKINRDILTGMTCDIKDIKLQSKFKVGDKIKRGDMLGEACGNTDGKTTVTITMFNLDGSVVEDMNKYMREEENSKYEELIKAKRENTNTLKENIGYDINPFLAGMQNVRHTARGLSIMTTTSLTKEEFIQKSIAYKDCEFSHYADVIYDTCIKNNISPVWCAAQAVWESSWEFIPDPFNYWGYGVFEGQSHGIVKFSSMEEAVQTWCDNLNQRIHAEENGDPVYSLATSKQFAPLNDKYTGGINNPYDVLSSYAGADTVDGIPPTPKEDADFMVDYVDKIIGTCKEIYGVEP